MKRLISFAVVAVVVSFCATAFAEGQVQVSQESPDKQTPSVKQPATVYIYSPDGVYARKWDPLLAATVLRLIEINLAASNEILPVYVTDNPKEKCYPCLKIMGEPLGDKKNISGAHKINVVLATAPGSEKVIATRDVSWKTFDEISQAVNSLSADALKNLSAALNLHFPENVKNLPDTAENIEILKKARAQSLLVHSGKIYGASKEIDKVLSANPYSAEAHYDAALCGAMLGYQDLFGRFHDRPRYLAKPLANLLFAEELAAPKSLDDKMTKCWVEYLCGYPVPAKKIVDSFSEKEATTPEAHAIKMFITRNFTLLHDDKRLDAAPIQQLAFMYAAQDCGATAGLDEMPDKMCSKSKTSAFFTTYSGATVSLEHGYTTKGITFALARDSYDLLRNEDIPLNTRQAIAKKLADILAISSEGNIKILSKRISSTLRRNNRDFKVSAVIAAMMPLYDAAIKASEKEPQSAAEKYKWQTISLRDFAELQRSILLMRISRRLRFMAYTWSVIDSAAALSNNIAKSVSKSMPEMSKYFEGFAICLTDEKEKQKELAKSILNSPLGEQCTIKFAIAGNWSGFMGRKVDMGFIPGRGCWQWHTLVQCSLHSFKHGNLYWPSVNMVFASDPYSAVAIPGYIWRTKSFSCLDTPEMRERAKYDMGVLTDAAWMAKGMKKYDEAEKYFNQAISSGRAGVNTYHWFVDLYIEEGKKDKAIEIALQAAKKFDDSVGASNLQGKLAVLLVEKGRNKEALEWGKKSACSYSSMGLNGLAVALEANGKIKEAHDVFEAKAMRYRDDMDDYLNFLMRHDYSVDEIVNAISELGQEYPNNKKRLADTVLRCIKKNPKYYDVLEKAYAGPLSYVDKDERKKQLVFVCNGKKWPLSKGKEFIVDAKNNEKAPIATGIYLKKGQKFIILPQPNDEWCGGGSMRDKFTNFEGYPGRGKWMMMFFKLNDLKQPVSFEPQIAVADGELLLYCDDSYINDNKGQIRVKVQLPAAEQSQPETKPTK